MRKIVLFIALLLSVAIPSSAQFVNITDTGVTDASGGVLVSGTECFTPVNNAGTPIPAEYPGGTITKTPKCSVITSGTMIPIQLVSSAVTSPLHLCYQRTVVDNNTGKYVIGALDGYGCVQPTAATNMNTVLPSTPGVSLQTTGPVGPQGIQGIQGIPGTGNAAVGAAGSVQIAGSGGNVAASDKTTILNTKPIGEYLNTARPELAYWLAAFHSCRTQVVGVNVYGTSRSIVDQTVAANGGAEATLSVTFAGRWVNRLATQLGSMCGFHGTGIVPFRWGTGVFASQGLNADYFVVNSGASFTATDTSVGPYQGADAMNITTNANNVAIQLYPRNPDGSLNFLPFDHLLMYCESGPGLNAWTMMIDGATVGTCGGTASSKTAVLATSSAVTLGQHVPVVLCVTSPCSGYAMQVTSGTTGIEVNNLSVGSGSAEIFALVPSTQYAYENLDPNPASLHIIEQACNESGDGFTPTQFQTTLNNMIAHATGLSYPASVLLYSELNDNLPSSSYYPVLIATHLANNTAWVDLKDRWPSTPAFLLGPDGTHESNIGNGEVHSGISSEVIDVGGLSASFATPVTYSIGAHSGAYAGSPTYAPGVFNTAVGGFSASTYIGLGSGSMPAGTTYTVEARLKTTSSIEGLAITGGATSSGGTHFFIGSYTNGHLYINAVDTGYTIDDGNWHHVALVATGTSTAYYADGNLVGTTAGSVTALSDTGGYIGNWCCGALPWTGEVDEVAVWSTAKYSGSTYTVPTSAYVGNESGLISLYHLDGTAIDSTIQ